MTLSRDLVDAGLQHADFAPFRSLFEATPIRTWLKPDEMGFLFGLGSSFGSGTALEIGTFEGSSAAFVCRGMKARGHGTLHSIDPHMGPPPYLGSAPYQFTYGRFRRNMEIFGVSDHVHAMLAGSVSAAAIWPAKPIDSVFVDGDHSYLGALSDVECWAPKVRVGGLVIIDDADDDALPELLDFIADLKTLRSLAFDDQIDGFAVFVRREADDFALMNELRRISERRQLRRPWDLAYVQTATLPETYAPAAIAGEAGLRVGYQLGYLARCGPGDYGVAPGATADDLALAQALSAARGDGAVISLEAAAGLRSRCRFVIAPLASVASFAPCLLPGGVMIGRSALEATQDNCISERREMLKAGLEACGWKETIHWGVYEPHFLSADAVAAYIARTMRIGGTV